MKRSLSVPGFLIKVPASTSNLGPGFDVIGLALSTYLEVDVSFGDNSSIIITHTGEGEGKVPLDSSNLILFAAQNLASKFEKDLPTNMYLAVKNTIPLGGGLGSSGAAVVAGVLLANHVLDLKISKEYLLSVCLEIESHPDNVTASLFGGCVLCCTKEIVEGNNMWLPLNCLYLPISVDKDIHFVAVSPDLYLSTEKSRQALPQNYEKKDVVFNLQRVAMVVAGLRDKKNLEILREAFKDKIHQPYRAKLIPGFEDILKLNNSDLRNSGLIGITLSGSGPTVLAIVCTSGDNEISSRVGKEIQSIFNEHGFKSRVWFLEPDTQGAVIENL